MSRTTFKAASLLAGTALVALSMSAGQASADTKLIQSKNSKTTLKIGGHVARQITVMDDGRSAVRHSDSDFSASRIVIDAASKLNKDVSVGTRMEIAVDDNRNTPASASVENGGRGGATPDLRTRKAEMHFTHKSLGRVWIGAGDAASNGASETSFTNYTMLPHFIGGTSNGAFRNASSNADEIAAQIFDVTLSADGLGRTTRVRYDTPNIAGFMLSTSHADNQTWDAAVRYSGKFMGTKIKASVSHAEAATEERLSAALAFQHSSGLGATYGLSYENPEGNSDSRINDPHSQNIQLHYTSKLNEMGTTQLVYMYTHQENISGRNEVARSHSAGVHQKIDAAGMEVALRWTTTELDSDSFTALDNDDVSSLGLHTRLKF